MRKKLSFILGCLLLLGALLPGCHRESPVGTEPSETKASFREEDVVYQSENVTLVKLERYEGFKVLMDHRAEYSEETFFSDMDVVVTGTVTKVQEVEVHFVANGFAETTKRTIFEFAVDEYLYSSADAIKDKDVLRIGVAYTSHRYCADYPMIAVGKSFLICGRLAAGYEDDVACMWEYLDYFVRTPRIQMMEAAGSKYILSSSMSQYFTDADRIADILGVSKMKVRQFARAHREEDIQELEIEDPDGLLSVMKERAIGTIAWVVEYGDVIADIAWGYTEGSYAIDRQAAKELVIDIVNRVN